MMATCADCVHVEVCKEYVVGLAAVRGVDLNMDELKAVLQCDDCEHFKDRSRFVELPFQPGDDVYCTRMFKIYKKTVEKIELDDDGLAIVTDDGYCMDSTICFRSQKEAEQALKEREENAN